MLHIFQRLVFYGIGCHVKWFLVTTFHGGGVRVCARVCVHGGREGGRLRVAAINKVSPFTQVSESLFICMIFRKCKTSAHLFITLKVK
jgi:hypothetical protein